MAMVKYLRKLTVAGCLFGFVSIAPPIEAQTAAPEFSPPAGTYTNAVLAVTITDATDGAIIYFTTDGTIPTTKSTQCNNECLPLVTHTQTIQAIAVSPDGIPSEVASATYTIPPDFNIAINPTDLTVKSGRSTTANITVQDVGGGTSGGNVNFACSGLPKGYACAFKVVVAPTPYGIADVTMTVSPSTHSAFRHSYGSGLVLAAVGICFFGWKRRRPMQILLLAVCIGALGTLTGCGGGTTTPSTSTATVIATSGSISHTADFTLTVY
ncbi:MAG: chitobiase/beta-hexosaminidase C-terminal domain-containing protein [Acidobacteriaceae bacterium]|nr:chitobiase/beta-hexosaminidase C-terminal domain-containing protein [Acidobacteriaceae bacterium]